MIKINASNISGNVVQIGRNNQVDKSLAEGTTLLQSVSQKNKVFVTYAWGNEEHNEQVISFTNHLRENGFDAFNDSYLIQKSASTDLQAMMLKNIHEANKVIVILTKRYAEKADKLEGGVGIEYQLILKDIDIKPQKYILVSFDPYDESVFPLSFRKRELVSLTNKQSMNNLFRKLKDVEVYKFSEVANETPVIEVKAIPAFEFKTKHAVDVTMLESYDDETPNVWDVIEVEKAFLIAIEANDLVEVKQIVQKNAFLLYDIYERKGGALPIFHDITFGKHNVDFVWLNDSSAGPEWVLLSVSKPDLQVMDKDGNISLDILAEIESVKGWQNYFELNPAEKKRVFGAVANFKFQLIIGNYDQWQDENASKWRLLHNNTSPVQIRSYNSFARSLAEIKAKPDLFFRFNQFHHTSCQDKLEQHWKSYGYMDYWRKVL